MRNWILGLACLLWSCAASAQIKTVVTGSNLVPSGGSLTGTISIQGCVPSSTVPFACTNQIFVSSDGYTVAPYSPTTLVMSGTSFSVGLIPNAGSSPTPTYYQVVYHLQASTGLVQWTEYWSVPSTGPVDRSTIQAYPNLLAPTSSIGVLGTTSGGTGTGWACPYCVFGNFTGVRANPSFGTLNASMMPSNIPFLNLIPPTGCASNQFPEWTGTAWTCTSSASGPASALSFGATNLNLSSTPPSPGQCLYYSGTNIAGTTCGIPMTWPTGAGLTVYSGSQSWSSSITLGNGYLNCTGGSCSWNSITSMTYPSGGIAVSTGSSGPWSASITPSTGYLYYNGSYSWQVPTLAQTIASVTHKWLNSYNSPTGLFAQSQPSSSDLSDYGSVPNAALANSSIGIAGTTNQIVSSTANPSLGGSTTLSVASPFTFPGKATGAASTSSAATFNIPPGNAPVAPVLGDLYNPGSSLAFYNGSAWLTPAFLGLPQTWTAVQTFGTNISIGGASPSGSTGSGNLVFSTSPTFIAPVLGAATATSINGTSIPSSSTLPTAASCATTGALGVFTGPTALGCGSADFTYSTHSFVGGSLAILNLSAMSPTAGFLPPASSGASPVTSGVVAYDSGEHNIVFGNASGTSHTAYVAGPAPSSGIATFGGTNFSLTSTATTGTGSVALATSPTFLGTVTIPTLTLTNPLAPAQGGVGSSSVPNSGQIPVGNSGGTAYAPRSISGDATLSYSGALTVTASQGTPFGTGAFATIANYAPINSPTFTGTVAMPAPTFNNITGTTQCLQANSGGLVSGTGSACGGGGSMTWPPSSGIAVYSGSQSWSSSISLGNGFLTCTSGTCSWQSVTSMVYPASGIAVSSGSGGPWATSITPSTGYLYYTGSAYTWQTPTLAQTISALSHKWLNSYNASTGMFTQTQPGSADLSDYGSILNSALANSYVTVNGQSISLGSAGTIPYDVNGTPLTSQAGISFRTSTTNSVGLTATPVNGSSNQVKFEITGSSYLGNAATATTATSATSAVNLASMSNYSVYGSASAVPASITPTANGQCLMSAASNYATTTPSFQACPSGGGNLSAAGGPTQYSLGAFYSSSTVGPIVPSAMSGVPLISEGTSNYPAFGALNLGGGSSIVTGTLPSANLPPTVVYTGQANTYTSGLQNFSSVTLQLPSSAAYAPTTGALCGWDSTNLRLVCGNGTGTNFMAWITTAATSGHIAEFTGTAGQLTDGGALGTFAGQNYATPPAIGGTTPAAGTFTTLTGTAMTASTGFTDSALSAGVVRSSAAGLFSSAEISGDCTTSGSSVITCTKTNSTSFGTFATQNYATPPAIGGSTPAAGSFTTLSASTSVTSPQHVAGASGTAGTYVLYPASGNFTTTLGTVATASSTVDFFSAVPTTNDLIKCVVSSTTCTLTDTGIASPSSVTSGGVIYASSSSALASSGTMTQYGSMYGGGAATAPGIVTPPTTNGTYAVGYTVIASSAVAPTAINLATYLGSPPAIGGSAAAAGSFTNFSASGTVSLPGIEGAGTYCLQISSSGSVTNTGSGCGSSGSSGTINNASQYSAPYYSSSGSTNTLSGVAAPTSPASVPETWTSTPTSGSAATQPSWSLPGVPVNPNSETTCSGGTLAAIDRASEIFCSGGSTASFTLPVHTSSGMAANFPFHMPNFNSGTLTITPTTDTIDGAASQTVLSNWTAFIYQDGTGNWHTVRMPMFAAFGSTCSNGLTWSTSTGIGCQSSAPLNGTVTQYDVLVGGAGSAVASVGTGTTNAPLLSGGASGNPGYSSILYPTSLTSGGILYGSSTTQLLSSALLASNALVVGGGAGNPPATGNGDFTYAIHSLASGASGIVNLGSATGTAAFIVPSNSSNTTSSAGALDFDTSAKNYHVFANGVDSIIAPVASSASLTNGHCVEFSVSSGNWTLIDAGGACTTGGSMTWPTGAGIAVYSGSSSWSTSLGETNGEMIYGSGGAWTVSATPQLGTASLPGTLTLSAGAATNYTTTLGSIATTSNTFLFPTAVPTNNHMLYCAVTSTTCTLTDSGFTYSSVATSSASLTSTYVVTGSGSQGIQTPSSAATIDGSGNANLYSLTLGKGQSLTLSGSSSGTVALTTASTGSTLLVGGTQAALTGGDINTSNNVVSTHITGGTTNDLTVFSSGNLANYGGASSCTNQAMTGFSATGASSCSTITGNYFGALIAAGTLLGNNSASAGAPSFVTAPVLGAASVAGTLALSAGGATMYTTTLGSAATTSNTIMFPIAIPTNNDLLYCAVSSTTCTLTDSSVSYANLMTASSNFTSGYVLYGAGSKAPATSVNFSYSSGALTLGAANTAGSVVLSAGGSTLYTTTLGSAAATSNTVNFFATAPTTGDLIKCVTSSTTCTLTDTSILASNVVVASSPGAGVGHFAGSTQTITSSAVVGGDFGSSIGAGTLFGNNGASAGSPAFTLAPVLGYASNPGTLGVSAGAATNYVATIASYATANYNFNLPVGAGTGGQPLLSGGGGSTAMTWGTLSVSYGGTGLGSMTAYNLYVGNGTSAPNAIAPSSTSGVALISQGAAANPAYGTVVIAGGGTGSATASGALINLLPTASEVGDMVYCAAYSSGCTSWALLSGNTSGTKWLQETSAGAVSWTIPTLDVLGNPAAAKTFADANYALAFNSATTTASQTAVSFGETSAATGSGDIEVGISTASGSTSIPLSISQAAGPSGAAAPNSFNITAGGGGAAASATSAGNTGAGFTGTFAGAGSAGGGTSGAGGAGGHGTLTLAGAGGGATSGTGGAGGASTIVLGGAGTASSAGAGGAGGAGTFTCAGAGAAGVGSGNTGGNGGACTLSAGNGGNGAGAGNSNGGNGGNITLTPGTGGTANGSGTAGTAGAVIENGVTLPASITSGAVLYGSASNVVSSSGALASGQILYGGGAGNPPAGSANLTWSSPTLTIGVAGTANGALALCPSTGSYCVTLGATASTGSGTVFNYPTSNGTSGYLLKTDGSGNTSWINETLDLVASPAASKTFADANYPVTFNSATTTGSQTAISFGETSAASGSGDVEVGISTATGSTSIPLKITQGANGPSGSAAPNVATITAAAGGAAASSTSAGNTGAGFSVALAGAGSAGGSTSGNGGTGGSGTQTLAGVGGGATSGTGGSGGSSTLVLAGAGGSPTAGAGGTAGAGTFTCGGAGGAGASSNNVGAAGGNCTITAGAGGNGAGTANNTSGGNIVLTPGAAGTGGSGTAGAAGTVQISTLTTAGFVTNAATTGALGSSTSPSIRQCTEVWGGTGTSNALSSGDDAVADMGCTNETGKSWTITAMYCASDNASNTTTVTPTFGSAGTGTTIPSGALTCGNSNAMASTTSFSNATIASGNGIDPGMGGTLTGTHIVLVFVYTQAN